jgi:hypothetical protein
MGCCLVAVLAAFVPRITLFCVWIFTDYVSRAFQSFIWPLLGLFFLPYTTLAYSLVFVPGVGVAGWRWFWVALGIFLDLCSYGGGGASRSKYDEW